MAEQPGLEVDYQHVQQPQQHEQPPLEVWNAPPDSPDKEAVVAHHDHQEKPGDPAPQAPNVTPETKPAANKKRLLWTMGIVAILIVSLGAVLGGVLGSKAGGKPRSTTATTTKKPQTLRQGSSLSVTGWRNMQGNVEKYLAFQTPQDELRLMRAPGSGGGGNDSWEAPISFHTSAKPDTQIAASTIIYGTYYKPQIEIFYTGNSSRLLGTNFNPQNEDPKFGDDSITSTQLVTGLNSSTASYWPWIIQQDSDGSLVYIQNNGNGNGTAPSSDWKTDWIDNGTVIAQAQSRLAVVPLFTYFADLAGQAGYAVFYQALEGGKLAVVIPDLESAKNSSGGGNYSLSWPTQIPSIELPRGTPIAAFSVARDESGGLVNTHVLYVDDKRDVNVLYTDLSSGTPTWKVIKPDALKGVDSGSNLACLTLATSPAGPSGGYIYLETGSEETMRCYFVRGGIVQEAKLTGSEDWSLVGSVPIP